MNNCRWKLLYALLAGVPVALWGLGAGPPPRRTGAAVDENGATCTACHRGIDLNTAPGFVRVDAAPYRAGERQTILVTVSHPEAQRWGFQLTARFASDETRKAGRFVPDGPIRVRCNDGQFAVDQQTCGADLEFASHGGTPESTRGGANGSKTFEVAWIAPEGQNLGDVIFYAAGNAANDSGNNQGDRIYTASARIEADLACNFIVRPRVQGIGNAATSQGAISMNTLVSIYGANFVPSGVRRSVGRGDIRNDRLPTELGCVAVEVGGRRVPITHVQQDQINIQIPTVTQTGSTPVKVIINPARPSEVSVDGPTINLQNYSPAFFTFNGTSIAALIAGTSTPVANPTVVPAGRPAAPGEIVELYATGLGPSDPVFQAGELVPSRAIPLRERITLSIGNTTLAAADILYAGLAPGAISGLYQINARISPNAPEGDLPLLVMVGGVSSPAGTTIPVRRRQ